MKQVYNITGMTCSACSAHVDKSVSKLEGIETVNVNLLQNKMTVEYNESVLNSDKIIEAVVKSGYGASLLDKTHKKENSGDENKANAVNDEAKNMRNRIIISFIFFIPLIYIAMAHMVGKGLPEILQAHENVLVLGLTEFILVLPIVYVNRKYFFVGFKTLFAGAPNMDSLIAIGSTAAVGYSIYALFIMAYALGHNDMKTVTEYSMELYFESAGTILTLITLGKYLESRSKKKTSDAITKLMNLAPKTAIVLRGETEVEISADDLKTGDIIVVKPGQSIPADGVIVFGNGVVDESVITGESIPVDKKIGDSVIGATINKNGYFRFEAQKVGEDTALSKIIELVEEAGSSKAPIAKLADKVSGVFVPIVIIIALVTALGWLLAGYSFPFALSTMIAVLVISCPCALGLATPTAIMVGTGKGAENGILIKSAESLEIAHTIDTIVLDKTGTITIGKPQVTDVLLNTGVDKEYLVKMASALESQSEHPLAQAIVEYAEKLNINIKDLQIHNFKTTEGQGIDAEVAGKKVLAGNIRLMEANHVEYQLDDHVDYADRLANEGKTPLYFAEEGKLLGIVAVADVIKENAPKAIESFKKMGIDVIMLTGDNKRTAAAIGKKVGITNIISEVLPSDKELEVRRLQEKGKKTAMVGDGINDAPALTRADVGIAIGAGTDIAIESADVVLMKSDLMDSVTAIQLSKAVIKNIKENLFWAFFYNVIGIPIAAGLLYIPFGLKLNPMIGAAAMSFSSVFVVSNALRLKLFKPAVLKQGQSSYKNLNTQQSQVIAQSNDSAEKNAEKKENNGMKKTLLIEGMSCGHCKARVEKTLNELGVASAEVNLDEKAAYVEGADNISDDTFKKAIEDAGYELVGIK